MNEQLVQIVGSILVLIPFALAQAGRVNPRSLGYLALNLAGSGILAVDAAVTAQWGFLLLEGTWAVVSLAGLLRPVRSVFAASDACGSAAPVAGRAGRLARRAMRKAARRAAERPS